MKKVTPYSKPLYLPLDTPDGVAYAVIPTGMSEEHFEFLVKSLNFHAEHCPGFVLKRSVTGIPATDEVKSDTNPDRSEG